MTAAGVRDLYVVTCARAVSTIGNEIAVIALLLRLHDAGAGGWAIAGLLIAGTLPLVVLAPLAGVVADHHDSRTVLVAGGLAQAAVCAVLAFAYRPLLVLALVALNAVGSAVAGPTFTALVPALVPRDRLAMAIGLQEGAQSVAILAGPALGGLLTGLTGGATVPLLLDAATFAVLAAAGGALRTRRAPAEAGKKRPLAGIALLATDPVVRVVAGLLTVLVLVGEGVTVAEVFLVRDTLGGSATAFGVLTTVFTGGMLAGTLAASGLNTLRRTLVAIPVAALVMAAGLVAVGWSGLLAVVFVAYFVAGVGAGALNVAAATLVLCRTPEGVRGRVQAALNGLLRAAGLGALGLGGVAATMFAPATVFILAGVAIAIATAATLPALRTVSD